MQVKSPGIRAGGRVPIHVQADIEAATFARYTKSQTADAMVRKDKRGWWPFSGA